MKKYIIIFSLLIIVISFIVDNYFEISTLETTYYELESDSLPKTFNNTKIVHITDFHNTKIKKLQTKLTEKILEEKPDLIVITGDFIDKTEIKEALSLIENIKSSAPIYYVPGNHEAKSLKAYIKLEKSLKEKGVYVLRNEKITLTKENDEINLIGIDDPEFIKESNILEETEIIFKNTLKNLTEELNTYTILLSHRPEYFEEYVNQNIDLTLTGHTHAGQVRFPILGSLYAPNQGLFPKYDKGLYEKNEKYMIIGRGIGTSGLPLRMLNKPELVVINLKSK